MEEEESLFLKYLGKSDKDKKTRNYIFICKDKTTFKTSQTDKIADPCYDATFKLLFGCEDGKGRLIDLLNSLIFPEDIYEDEEIEELTFVSNKFSKFNEKYNNDKIRADITCKIKTSEKNEFLICLEIQIGRKYDLDKRLFNYNTCLGNIHQFKDCYSIGLLIFTNKIFSKLENTKLIKNYNTKNEESLNSIKIIEIDINSEVNNILNDYPVKINDKIIKNKGKEYIKLFGIRNWCSNNSDRFRIPNIYEVSSNDIFKECLRILSSFNQDDTSLMKLDEQNYFDTINSIKNEGYIDIAYSIFILGIDQNKILNALDSCNVDFKGLSDSDIKLMLRKKKENDVNNFIKFLRTNKYIN